MNELYQPDECRLAEYWGHIQGCMGELYSSPIHTISRINGHAIAGGLIVAMATDYRVMIAQDPKGKSCKTGLTEAMIGMTMPWWMQRLTVLTAGPRTAERSMTLSPLMDAEQALAAGFIDGMVETEDQLDNLVQRELDLVVNKVPFGGRAGNKLQYRSELTDKMRSTLDADTEQFVRVITSSMFQKALGAYLASLRKGK